MEQGFKSFIFACKPAPTPTCLGVNRVPAYLNRQKQQHANRFPSFFQSVCVGNAFAKVNLNSALYGPQGRCLLSHATADRYEWVICQVPSGRSRKKRPRIINSDSGVMAKISTERLPDGRVVGTLRSVTLKSGNSAICARHLSQHSLLPLPANFIE